MSAKWNLVKPARRAATPARYCTDKMKYSRLVLWAALLSAPLASFFLHAEESKKAAQVELRLELPAEVSTLPDASTLVLHRAEGEEVRSVPLTSRSPVVALQPNSTWTIGLQAPGLWAPEQVVTSGPAETRTFRKVPVWQLATMRGIAKPAERAAKLPEALRARFEIGEESTPDEGTFEGTMACPIEEDGHFQCEIPAARVDLRLSAQDFVPHYYWGLEPTPKATTSLGTVRLRKGASLVGRVALDAAKAEKIEIELSPWQAAGGDSGVQARLAKTRRTTRPNDQGFFQFGGLPEGAYVLEARHPDFAPTRLFPVEVFPRGEVVLQQALQLRPPLTLSLTLEPPLDWLGDPWKVRIFRGSAGSSSLEREPVYTGVATMAGTLTLPDLSPGRFNIKIADSQGNGFWSEPALQIETEEDADLYIPLELFPIEGRVTLGDEPLPAKLWFGGKEGTWAELETDEGGEFVGALPKAGRFKVEVLAHEPPVRSVQWVRIPEDGSSPHRLDIEVPDTLVYGRVVDSSGSPVSPAGVLVQSAGDSVGVDVDAEGTFEIRGLLEGEVRLMAQGSTAEGVRSSPVETAVAVEGQPFGPVELRLHDVQSLEGQVVSEQGHPVAGATIVVSPPPEAPGFGVRARTGLAGTFKVEMPETVTRLHVLVMPPGHALKAFEIDTSYGRSFALQVPSLGGTLELAAPQELQDAATGATKLTIKQDGILLSKSQLYHWALGHQGRVSSEGFVVPAMAPGYYQACMVSPGVEDPPRCTSGQLTAHGTLSLALVREEKADSK